MNNDPYVYFLYSEQQEEFRKETERKMNRIFNPGQVFIRGQRIPFTEISFTNTNKYTDVKVVAEGYKSTMKYKDILITGR